MHIYSGSSEVGTAERAALAQDEATDPDVKVWAVSCNLGLMDRHFQTNDYIRNGYFIFPKNFPQWNELRKNEFNVICLQYESDFWLYQDREGRPGVRNTTIWSPFRSEGYSDGFLKSNFFRHNKILLRKDGSCQDSVFFWNRP